MEKRSQMLAGFARDGLPNGDRPASSVVGVRTAAGGRRCDCQRDHWAPGGRCVSTTCGAWQVCDTRSMSANMLEEAGGGAKGSDEAITAAAPSMPGAAAAAMRLRGGGDYGGTEACEEDFAATQAAGWGDEVDAMAAISAAVMRWTHAMFQANATPIAGGAPPPAVAPPEAMGR